jgi:endonuclease YncB( thermonuclease family)
MLRVFTYILLLVLTACNNRGAPDPRVKVKVTGVKDGDTIEVLFEGKVLRVRLLDIDCPEKGQAYGHRAKEFTKTFCESGFVEISWDGKLDRYGRALATIYSGKTCLNSMLVRSGLAWHYKKYSKKKFYAKLESQARSQRIGLWQDDNPIPPWDFRKGKKSSASFIIPSEYDYRHGFSLKFG